MPHAQHDVIDVVLGTSRKIMRCVVHSGSGYYSDVRLLHSPPPTSTKGLQSPPSTSGNRA